MMDAVTNRSNQSAVIADERSSFSLVLEESELQLDAAFDSLAMLAGRIAPALSSDEFPNPQDKPAEPTCPGTAPITATLFGMAERLRFLNARIQELSRRVEL